MFALSAVLLALVSVYFLLALVTLGRLTVLLKRGGRDGRGRDKPVAELPCVAVVLPVRGIDPFLHNTLRGLMQQDYPSYEVHVIVDSEEDDAWQFVKERCGITAGDAIHLHVLKSPRATCSLKNSALVQVFKQLKRDCRVVALLDADVIPHPGWLRALVEPLSDERVVVTTGYRWYIPPVRNWGGLVRAIWNAGAMPQLWLSDIVWGGSIALKRDVLEAAGLLETWSNSLSTDCVLPTLVKRIGRRIAFAPNAIMVNSERISLADLIPWVTRQSLVVRLYHTYWSGVLTRATFLCTLVAGSILLMGIGACTGRWQICSMALATLVLHWFTNVTCLLWLDHAVRQRLKYVGAEVPAFHGRRLGRAFVGMVLANLAFLVSLGHAAAARQVAWRGIQYRIHSRFQIEMTGYRLFSGEPQEAESVSLV